MKTKDALLILQRMLVFAIAKNEDIEEVLALEQAIALMDVLSTAVAEDASPITIEELSTRRDRYQDAALSAATTSRWRFFYSGKADAYNDLLRELQNQTQE